MAAVSSVPSIKQRVGSILLNDIRAPGIMASRREIVEEPISVVIEEKIYVALGKEVEKNKSVLRWALQNSRGKRICIIHVHQPAKRIRGPMGGKVDASTADEREVRAYRETEKRKMHGNLDQYLLFCQQAGVRAEKMYLENDFVDKGILEFISDHGIRELVMGAAADKQFSKKMTDLKSRKALSVREQAPASCHIWFVCKGNLIRPREGRDVADTEVASSSLPVSPNIGTGEATLKSKSVSVWSPSLVTPYNSRQNLRRAVSEYFVGRGGRRLAYTSPDSAEGLSTPQRRSDEEGSSDGWDGSTIRSTSQGSGLSLCSPIGVVDGAVVPFMGNEGCEQSQSKEDLYKTSPPSVLDGDIDGTLYDQLERAIVEAAQSTKEVFEEAVKREKAEKDAIEAIRRAKASETLYSEELKQRKGTEEALANEKEELGKLKKLLGKMKEELRVSLEQNSLLENQNAELDNMVKDLEEKIISAVELLQTYKKERDDLQVECDNALKEAEELRKYGAETLGQHVRQFFTDFSFSEIKQATNNFDPSLKIGQGGYGSIYKALLRCTQVAIKKLNSTSMQGPSEFQQEVDVLSKMRHPNLITLVGACPEVWALIYEYLPNGSLEDRLNCQDNSPPLSWQTRIRIATELCSVLIFLHSSKPYSIVHGDLKPSNILLDAKFVSKLSDFGICRLLDSDTTVCCRTDPKGTYHYMDPEFGRTGELTPKSDVYSFGIILLQLLTGRQALGITKEVQYAIDNGKLKSLLDPLAGDWPFVQAEQLANLALRCCDMNRKNRPDLATQVWRVLEPMRASCGGSLSFRLGSEEHCQPPSYFICPIFQEVMRDPHVAADGYTYEAEALKGWLDSDHDTSPMTNVKLLHQDLVPNHALRSAIQEWLQDN